MVVPQINKLPLITFPNMDKKINLDYYPMSMKTQIIRVKVIPKGSRNEIVGWEGDLLKVKIAAAPDKGKANEALVRFLAKEWDTAPSHIRILSGQKSRIKVLECYIKNEIQNTGRKESCDEERKG